MGDSSKNIQAARLLSIGDFSRLSGAHIKSLRYYDRIGVLRPIRVNPHTGYRAYAPWQLRIAESIALCVDFNLPLKHFTRYVADPHAIDYARLTGDALAEAEARLKRLRARIRLLHELESAMAHGDRLIAHPNKLLGPVRLPGLTCRVLPCPIEADPAEVFQRLVDTVLREGLSMSYDSGALILRRDGVERRFLYVSLCQPFPRGEKKGILRLPSLMWRCQTSERPLLEPDTTLPAAFRQNNTIILECDLFTGRFAIDPPTLEWRIAPIPPTLSRRWDACDA